MIFIVRNTLGFKSWFSHWYYIMFIIFMINTSGPGVQPDYVNRVAWWSLTRVLPGSFISALLRLWWSVLRANETDSVLWRWPFSAIIFVVCTELIASLSSNHRLAIMWQSLDSSPGLAAITCMQSSYTECSLVESVQSMCKHQLRH